MNMETLEMKQDILIKDFQRARQKQEEDNKEILINIKKLGEELIEHKTNQKWHKLIASVVFFLLLSFNIYTYKELRYYENKTILMIQAHNKNIKANKKGDIKYGINGL